MLSMLLPGGEKLPGGEPSFDILRRDPDPVPGDNADCGYWLPFAAAILMLAMSVGTLDAADGAFLIVKVETVLEGEIGVSVPDPLPTLGTK